MPENFFGITDVGRQRDNNEDAFIAELISRNGPVLAGVIDGVGGYEGGEIAAAIARESFIGAFRNRGEEYIAILRAAFAEANEKIFKEKIASGAHDNMSCVATLALVDIRNNKFYYAHVGDTRLYLFRDQSLIKLTQDQSFVGFLEDSGRLTEAEAMGHIKRNEINKALGFDISADFSGEYIETGESPFLPGDTLLLCSDGLTDLVNAEGIRSVLFKKISLEEKGKELVAAANREGGKDNITVVLVQNSRKPVKQEAQRPALQKKEAPQKKIVLQKAEQPQPGTAQKELIKPLPVQQKGRGFNKNLLILLSVLAFLFLTGFIWALTRKTSGEMPQADKEKIQKNAGEIRLQAFINSGRSDTVLISNASIGSTIYLTDTLWIRRDSLYLKGADAASLVRHSNYGSGPAIVLTPQCRWIVLDSITFRDFNLGILTSNHNVLQLKNVQFKNCAIAVGYKVQPDSIAVSGSFMNKSSSPKPRNEE